MTGLPESLRCLFSAEIEYRDGSYVLEVPEQELETGTLAEGAVYRVAVHERPAPEHPDDADRSTGEDQPADRGATPDRDRRRMVQGPPVEEGERREVTIEGVGDEGDGIAKLDRGYVLIVPGTTPGEQVEVEVTTVTPTVGFAEVIDSDA